MFCKNINIAVMTNIIPTYIGPIPKTDNFSLFIIYSLKFKLSKQLAEINKKLEELSNKNQTLKKENEEKHKVNEKEREYKIDEISETETKERYIDLVIKNEG